MTRPIFNTRRSIMVERVQSAGPLSAEAGRWIGRCKRCRRTHKLEGRIVQGYGDRFTGGYFIEEIGTGNLYLTDALGSNPYEVAVPCPDQDTATFRAGDHWCRLRRVIEGTKNSKHVCGARCTNATGPNCDCRCKGQNHGSGLGA